MIAEIGAIEIVFKSWGWFRIYELISTANLALTSDSAEKRAKRSSILLLRLVRFSAGQTLCKNKDLIQLSE